MTIKVLKLTLTIRTRSAYIDFFSCCDQHLLHHLQNYVEATCSSYFCSSLVSLTNALRLHGVGLEGLFVTDRQEALTCHYVSGNHFLNSCVGRSTNLTELLLQHRRGSARSLHDRIWHLDLLLMLYRPWSPFLFRELRAIVAIVTPNISQPRLYSKELYPLNYIPLSHLCRQLVIGVYVWPMTYYNIIMWEKVNI